MARTFIPLKDFFRNPERTAYKISPNGEFIAFKQPFENRMNIVVQPREGGEAFRITAETERDIDTFVWKNNQRLLYIKDFGGDENFHLFAVDRDGGNLRDLTPFENVVARVIDDLPNFENEVIVGMNKRNPEAIDAYRLNIESGELHLIGENPGNIVAWMTDHNGVLRMAITSDGSNSSILYRTNENEEFRTIITTDFTRSCHPLFFDFDNHSFFASSNIGRDKTAIVKINPDTAEETEVLFVHPRVDSEYMSYSLKRKVLTYISYTTWKYERIFLDFATEKLYNRLAELLPGYQISISDRDKEERFFIVRSYTDCSLGSYFLYDSLNDSLTTLHNVAAWLNDKDLSPMKPVAYTSRDGLLINGYLTLPKGVEAKNLPIIINPHGGPWHRDSWGFNPEIQFLANRGYAVFQMNFRGSTGYGREFLMASFKEWGKTMQDDVTDGVEWLIQQGIADPKRIAIYGGSYGGYCTLAGLTFTPDLYACGVDFVSVSNLFTFMNTFPPYWEPLREKMYLMVGHPEHDKELLESASPVFHVDNIKAPLFVAQGAKDPRVNIEESNQIVAALQKRGIDVPYMVKENEGHGFRNEENKMEFYEEMEKFLAKHLHPSE